MVLMIDNYDSFTYNIVQYCSELGVELKIIRNDALSVEEIEALYPEKIIISPGPGSPDEAGVTQDLIRHFQDKVPILGICLGHQSIAQVFGGEVIRAKNMMHGKTSRMDKKEGVECRLFQEVPKTFIGTRYHSLIVNKNSLPQNIIPTVYSSDDHEIMAFKIKDKNIYGVQFHPESIMSEYGHKILENFLSI